MHSGRVLAQVLHFI